MACSIRIGCAVPRVIVADTAHNTKQICRYMDEAATGGCDFVVFPELSLTGCTCGSLFYQQLLLDGAMCGLEEILSHSARYPLLTVIAGLPIRENGVLYNCAAVIRGGQLLGKAYQEGIESAFFADGSSAAENCRMFSLPGGETLAILIGKEVLTLEADVIVNLYGQPQFPGQWDERCAYAREASRKGWYVCCGAGWGESVTDGVYGGHSVIACCGQLVAQNTKPLDDAYLLIADQNSPAIPFEMPEHCTGLRMPFCTGYESEIFDIQTAGLARRLQLLNAKAVVGVSGGLDSTLALLVAVEAMGLLDRPASQVCAVTMPGFGTTDRTFDNAMALMKLLGVTIIQIPIQNAVCQHFADIGHDEKCKDLTYENAQARERTQILMDYAGRVGGIVVGTGDLSELALGWCTYNGDHMSMYGVNASIPKTLIPEVIRAAARLPRYAAAKAVLEDVIATPISPELLPPDENGNIAQHTEDTVGPYILHDFFLYYTLKCGAAPREIYIMARQAFPEYEEEIIKKWLSTFYRRFFAQQFKRNCMPEGVNATGISLSPRGDWQMPGDASAALWLAEVEKL